MPAHVTVLYPFAPVDEVGDGELAAIFARAGPFDYVLRRLDEFPGGLAYLAPEPREPFVELSRLVVGRFPSYPPYDGEFELDELVPHVTVVATEDEAVLADVRASVPGALPIVCRAGAASLMIEKGGRWTEHTSFPLGG